MVGRLGPVSLTQGCDGRSDLSDLQEKVDWALSNPKNAQEIAKNGQLFARKMTLETETKFAASAININSGSAH